MPAALRTSKILLVVFAFMMARGLAGVPEQGGRRITTRDFSPGRQMVLVDGAPVVVMPDFMRVVSEPSNVNGEKLVHTVQKYSAIRLADADAYFADIKVVNEGSGPVSYPGEGISRPLYSGGQFVFPQGEGHRFACDVARLRPATDATALLMRTFFLEDVDTLNYARVIRTVVENYGEPSRSCFISLIARASFPTKWMVITTRYLDAAGNTARDEPSPNVILALGLSDEMIYPSNPIYNDDLSIIVFCQTKVWDYVDSRTYKRCSEGISIGVYRADALNNLHCVHPGILVRGIFPPEVTDGCAVEKPVAFVLEQNYPNPFNPTTTIEYALPYRSHARLTVFNLLGQVVVDLVNGEIEAGYHEVTLDASALASGVYFYRMEAGSFVQFRKMLLIR